MFSPYVLEMSKKSQREIALQMPLVKLVQDYCTDAAQFRIGQQTPRENAFGQKTQTCARPADVFEPDLVADGVAHTLV